MFVIDLSFGRHKILSSYGKICLKHYNSLLKVTYIKRIIIVILVCNDKEILKTLKVISSMCPIISGSLNAVPMHPSFEVADRDHSYSMSLPL